RGTDDPSGLGVYPNWAWSWPANRRVMYNRASCDPAGKPWDPERRQVWWNDSAGRWAGHDVPDFKIDSAPIDHMGPFIMNPEGVGRLFGPLSAFQEVPIPENYELIASPKAPPLPFRKLFDGSRLFTARDRRMPRLHALNSTA